MNMYKVYYFTPFLATVEHAYIRASDKTEAFTKTKEIRKNCAVVFHADLVGEC